MMVEAKYNILRKKKLMEEYEAMGIAHVR